MHYILIILIGANSVGSGINMQEFETKERCEIAGKLITDWYNKDDDGSDDDGSIENNAKYQCVEK